MNFRRNLVLACVMLSVSDMHGNGPLRRVVSVSARAATTVFCAGSVLRLLQTVIGCSAVSVEEISKAAALTGLSVGIVATPVTCGLYANDIRREIASTKWDYVHMHRQASNKACIDLVSRYTSPAKKLESKRKFIANQLALYKLYEYIQAPLSFSCIEEGALDVIPLLSTAFGLVPAVLCDCSNDFLATILAANYCVAGTALLHVKMRERKWKQIDQPILDLFVFGYKDESNTDIQIPDNFMKAAHLKIAIAQRRADEIYAQERREHTKLYPNVPYNYSSMRDNTDVLMHDEVRKIASQVIKLDDAALSAMDYESRVTKKFEVQITRNEKNTERIVNRIEK